MGVTNFPDGVNIGNDAGGTSLWQLGGTSVNVTAAELNAIAAAGGLDAAELDFLDGATAGTVVASKAIVAGAFGDVDVIDFSGEFKIDGVAVTSTAAELNILDGVTSTAAELNKLDGVLGNALAYDNAGFRIAASGSTAITGSGTVASGMADVQHVVASLANVGTAAGEANVVFADPSVGGGSVLFSCYDLGGTAATSAGTVNWIAVGTAA